jgi:hypothetical protein
VLGPDGQESTATSYEDDGRVKRQGARFRVFEYDPDRTLLDVTTRAPAAAAVRRPTTATVSPSATSDRPSAGPAATTRVS